ncbi:MAG: hypothetical protein R3344_14760, partial [Acidobacteriota bacterium]|nr:hypothetical protein [Acidobacteriota bacterium]
MNRYRREFGASRPSAIKVAPAEGSGVSPPPATASASSWSRNALTLEVTNASIGLVLSGSLNAV